MSDYEAKKPVKTSNKKRAGNYKTNNIKSVDYIPSVFNTPLNNKWLDATLDQMISKGALEDIDAFVGSRSGKYSQIGDVYLAEGAHEDLRRITQLEPSLVTTLSDGTTNSMITPDDIANSVSIDFDNYNYNAAYNSQSYGFNPPIDYDKFLNYNSYYWATDLPVYKSFNDDGNAVYTTDVLTDIRGKPTHTFVDDDNSFELENGMLIKLQSGYGALDKNTYLVTGVGYNIKLQLHTEYDSITDRFNLVWTDDSPYKDTIGGVWDSNEIVTWAYSLDFQGDDPRGYKSIHSLINAHNVQVNAGTAPPLLYYYDGGDMKKSYLYNGMIFKLDSDWPSMDPIPTTAIDIVAGSVYKITSVGITDFTLLGAPSNTVGVWFTATSSSGLGNGTADEYLPTWLDQFKIYQVSISNAGIISTTELVNARYNNVALDDYSVLQFVPSGLTDDQQLLVDDAWNNNAWDTGISPTVSTKDYHVIATRDNAATIWSRGNYWVHHDTIVKLGTLITNYNPANNLVDEMQAKRPIIEFSSNMHLWDNIRNSQTNWWGPIQCIVKTKAESLNMQAGTKFALLNDSRIYINYATTGVAATSVAVGIYYEITSTGTTDFTVLGAPDSNVGTVFEATKSGALVPGTTGVVTQRFQEYAIMNTGDTALVLASPEYVQGGFDLYGFKDMYYDGTTLKITQPKTKVNQPPLFKIWDDDGIELKDQTKYPGNTFTGNKVFGYKVGTGSNDSEIGFPLSYKDIGTRADYLFEAFLHTLNSPYNATTSTGGLIGGNRSAIGLFSFQIGEDRRHIYTPSLTNLGAKTDVKVEVTDPSVALTIPVGYDAWRNHSEYWVYSTGAIQFAYSIAEKYENGLTVERRKVHPNIILVKGAETNFHDLIGTPSTYTLKIYAEDKTTVLGPAQGVVYHDENGDGFNETLSFTPADNGIYYYGYSTSANHTLSRIIVTDSIDQKFHELFIDGKWISPNAYTVNANNTIVPADLLSNDSIVDLEYYSNTQTPIASTIKANVETLTHNATNKILKELTITETLDHWKSKVRAAIGFNGLSYGKNNYHKSLSVSGFGGEIFVHSEPSIMHDLNYADNRINIKESLANQGRDWWAFKRRFESQIRRLYNTKTYSTTKEIVNDALNAITSTKKGSKLHKFSNMVYSYDDKSQRIITTTGVSTYNMKFTANSDFTIRDHVYVYLTDKTILSTGNERFVQKLLVKDKDYTLNGSTITLLITPVPGTSGAQPILDIYWHNMDYDCHVPASMAKLGLWYNTEPQISGTTIIGHDGAEYNFNSNAVLDEPSDPKYDVVNAAFYELEKRVYSGIVDNLNTHSPVKYIPSVSNAHWYTLADMDLYTEQHFADWKARTDVTSLTPAGYYNAGDDTTWNYSTIVFGEHFTGNRLPGHWKGAYTVLFGTVTPHLTPWHMLGHSKKPTWWDTYYSWTDPTKRAALIAALATGHINDPGDAHPINDINYARIYWNFTTQCPVDTSGNLVARSTVLGTPSALDQSQEFIFGDWGPVEWNWRNSSLGQSAMVDSAVKLNPCEAFNEFFQPGSIIKALDLRIDKEIYHIGRKLIDPSELVYAGKYYGKKVGSIKVVSSTTGYVPNATVKILDTASNKQATAVLDIDSSGKIVNVTLTDRGINYTNKPIIDIINGSSVDDVFAEFEITMVSCPERTNGINEAQLNNLDRNFYEDNLEQQYYSLDTKLIQKVAGFTSKNLISFKAESGPKGQFRINENDFSLCMYTGTPTDIIVASDIKITKSGNDFVVSGMSSSKQRFKINEVVKDIHYTDVEVNSAATVKKYANFTQAESIVEFGAKFSKIQDLYDFVRGNRNYLETSGVIFEQNKDAEALDAAKWAVTADSGDTHVVSIGSSISYNARHGYIMQFNTLPNQANGLLDTTGNSIDLSNMLIDRSRDSISVSTNQGTFFEIGSIGFAEVDFEHAAVFENITQFNDVIYNAVNNQRHYRLCMQGQRTKDWDGNQRAPGYLVFANSITENWDTSAKTLDDFYSYDIENVNAGVSKAENLTIGNVGRSWITDTLLTNSEFGKFYQGMLRDKGTSGLTKPYSRSNLVNGGDSKISLNEEWMLRVGHFGDTRNVNASEIALDETEIKDKEHLINFELVTDENWVNNKKVDQFEEISFAEHLSQNIFKTAGEVTVSEASTAVFNVNELATAYDATAEYANIPTWNGQTSYKRRDLVRRNGKLYRLKVASIGYDSEPTNLTFTGSKTNPVFDYADPLTDPASAIIDSQSIWFNSTTRVFNNLIALGTAGAQVASPSSITIDSTTISLSYQPLSNIVDTSAPDNGNPSITTGTLTNPVIVDNTGKYLIINGATINMYNGSTILVSPTANLTRAQIAQLISDSDPSGRLVATDTGTSIKIVYDVLGDPNGTLTIGAGTANTDLGLSVATYNPVLIQISADSPMSPTVLANLINANVSLPANITASVSPSDQLTITKTPTASTAIGVDDSLSLTGLAASGSGLPVTTGPMTYNDVPRPSSVTEAANFIVNKAISGVTATTTGDRLTITSINDSINLGSSSNPMNATAGLPGGIQYATSTVVNNTFELNDWDELSGLDDPTRFRIQVVDDSAIINTDGLTGTVRSKQQGWNVLQPHSFDWYTLTTARDEEGNVIVDNSGSDTYTTSCSICAGTATSDGNDAEVSVADLTGIPIAHGLEVGDYVMLVNTTTKPSTNGIHQVTALGDLNNPNKFYIDMYIEECGYATEVYVLRNCRFDHKDALDTTIGSGANTSKYRWKTGDIAWTSYITLNDYTNRINRGTYRWRYDGTQWVQNTNRTVTTRSTNAQLQNVLIYSNYDKSTLVELEVFDPIIGIIPGVADREIDSKSPLDHAVYTHSTGLGEFDEADAVNAWGEGRIGKTWWNTKDVVYYDYGQGSADYRKLYWGKLFPGSTIDVYEWTKSSVAPDEWENAVSTGLEIFGKVATGVPYFEFSSELNENIYYYSELEEYNVNTGDYDKVYYFWVKDKTTLPNTKRRLTTSQIASIILDPTANGISWCAAIDGRKLVISNVSPYIGKETVLQVNKKLHNGTHDNWLALKEGTGLIPQYWYIGLRDNLLGRQLSTDITLPNTALHLYNRFGDDRSLAQTWFNDTLLARCEAVSAANRLLKNMDMLSELSGKWDRNIGLNNRVIDIEVEENTTPLWTASTAYVVNDRIDYRKQIYICKTSHTSTSNFLTDKDLYWRRVATAYDLTRMWDWADYVSVDRDENTVPSLIVNRKSDLATVDTNKHNLVQVKITQDDLDRDEIHSWTGTEWKLVEKKNSTIAFNDIIYNPANIDSWDANSWDSVAWDGNTDVYAYYFVKALREDIFIEKFTDNFNWFFFAIIYYTLGDQKHVDWLYKTTYVELDIETPVNNTVRRYRKNGVSELFGYINTVKPFHTKIRQVFDANTIMDEAAVMLDESRTMTITARMNDHDVQESTDAQYNKTERRSVYKGTWLNGDGFTNPPVTETYVGADFTDATVYDAIGADEFLNADMHDERTTFRMQTLEDLSIIVTTNTSGSTADANSRTLVYMQDDKLALKAYSLEESESTTLTSDVTELATTIPVTDGTVFEDTGYAWVNGEVVHYGQRIGNSLENVTRAVGFSKAKKHYTSTTIVDITNKQLSIDTSIVTGGADANGYYQTEVLVNDLGKSILDSSSVNILPLELQASTKGIDL